MEEKAKQRITWPIGGLPTRHNNLITTINILPEPIIIIIYIGSAVIVFLNVA